MRKISTIISVLLMATVAASGAISTQVATVGLEGTQEAPKNNGNTKGIMGPPPVSNHGGLQGIGPSQNGVFTGNQQTQCYTDWGYNRCTDILTIGGVDKHDLGVICTLQSVKFDAAFNHYERGMFAITSVNNDGTSLSINYIIFCGEGAYFEGASHFVDYDFDYGKEGYSLMDFLYDMVEAMGDHHEPYGGPIDGLEEWREEEMLKKIAAKKALEEWKAAHSEQGADTNGDDDTDTDDDNDNSDTDDDDTPSLHDEGCPEDEPFNPVLC